MPGLLNFLDGCNLLSFLLWRFGLFGSLAVKLGLGLLVRGFWLLLGLCGWYWCRSPCGGLHVKWLFGSSGSASDGSHLWFLRLGLGWLGPLLTGGFVKRALLTGRRLMTRRAHWLVFGRWMRNGERRVVEATSWHQPLGLTVETQPLLFLKHRGNRPGTVSVTSLCFTIYYQLTATIWSVKRTCQFQSITTRGGLPLLTDKRDKHKLKMCCVHTAFEDNVVSSQNLSICVAPTWSCISLCVFPLFTLQRLRLNTCFLLILGQTRRPNSDTNKAMLYHL